jgi:hypothetical protein
MPAVFVAGSVDATIAASETERLYDRAPTPNGFCVAEQTRRFTDL